MADDARKQQSGPPAPPPKQPPVRVTKESTGYSTRSQPKVPSKPDAPKPPTSK